MPLRQLHFLACKLFRLCLAADGTLSFHAQLCSPCLFKLLTCSGYVRHIVATKPSGDWCVSHLGSACQDFIRPLAVRTGLALVSTGMCANAKECLSYHDVLLLMPLLPIEQMSGIKAEACARRVQQSRFAMRMHCV
jgi:hypothetical protein